MLGLLPTPTTIYPIPLKIYIFPSLLMVKSEKVNVSAFITTTRPLHTLSASQQKNQILLHPKRIFAF